MTTTIQQHPDPVTLMSYAAGTISEPLAAVVAAHAAVCSQCRRELGDLNLLGATLVMASSAGERNSAGLVVPRIPEAELKPLRQSRTIDPAERLPAPIALTYSLSFDSIPWKRLGPGIWHHRLPLSEGVEGDLRLLKIGAGREMPNHGHGGAELTLVLDGAFSDVTGRYGRGDLQDVDEGIEHKPLADKIAGCICLIASERPARFKGLMGRLLQPLTGM
ncbi:MAG: ChrR family anti-sigma-E factor [Hyphomicrobiaceae bacterium]